MSDSDEWVERQPAEMDTFAEAIDIYVQKIDSECEELLGNMRSAEQYMQDDPSERARRKIISFQQEIRESLPNVIGVSNRLKTSAEKARRALAVDI